MRSQAGLALGLLLSLYPAPGHAAPEYFSTIPSWWSAPYTTIRVCLGDVDGDGDLDLVCANNGSNSGTRQPNTLYLNHDGTFSTDPDWKSNVSNNTNAVCLGDVDNDGDLDLVFGDWAGAPTLYANDGGVLTSAPVWIGDIDYMTSVALGDINGDGYLDLVCGNRDRITLYVNNGDVQSENDRFVRHPDVRVAAAATSVALGDVDGDGDLDLVCGRRGSFDFMYVNPGDGAFAAGPTWRSTPTYRTETVRLGDVNGDGRLDLVCGSSGDQPTALYLNVGGPAVFDTAPAWLSPPNNENFPSSTMGIDLGDVDGDGDLDLVIGDLTSWIMLILNEGGMFADAPAARNGPLAAANDVCLGDVDADGDLDLILGRCCVIAWDRSNTLHLNTGGVFADTPAWTSGPAYRTSGLAAGDVDLDGDLDLVCGNFDGPDGVYMNEGGVLAQQPLWLTAATDSTTDVVLGDVDNDGDLDLVCAKGGQRNTLYRNDGGVFSLDRLWSPAPTGATCVALGDVDGDGDLDLACGKWQTGGGVLTNELYVNEGGRLADAAVWHSDVQDWCNEVAWADVDGDGDLDLVSAHVSRPNHIWQNAGGAQVLSTPAMWTSIPFEHSAGVAIGDVDADGAPDIVFANWAENTVYLNGGGQYPLIPSYTLGTYELSSDVALGDVDGDGDLDAAFGNVGPETLCLNDGGRISDQPVWVSGPGDSTTTVLLADMDGDGDLDLVCGNGDERFGPDPTSDPQKNTMYLNLRNPGYKGDPTAPTNQLANNDAHLRRVLVSPQGVNVQRVAFTAVDVESDPMWIVADYQYAGDPAWYPAAVQGYARQVGPFASSPAGVAGELMWDVSLLPFDPRDVVLRLRVVEVPRRVSSVQHVEPYRISLGPIQPARPRIDTSVDTLQFDPVALGDTVSASVAVRNSGTAVMTVTGFILPTSDMHVDAVAPLFIPPGQSVPVTVYYEPTNASNPPTGMWIESDDPFMPERWVAMNASVETLDFSVASPYPTGVVRDGADVSVPIVMRDIVDLDSALVFFRLGGSAGFGSVRMHRVDDPGAEQYIGIIPGSSVTSRGIAYYVQVFNGVVEHSGTLRYLRTRVANLAFPGRQPAGQYDLISIPMETDGSILGALADDVGGKDDTRWRLWQWGPGESAGAYEELPDAETRNFQLGRGYWFVSRDAVRLDTEDSEGLSTPADSVFDITLEPGYNLIGHPFHFEVDWASVLVNSMPMAQADTLVEPPVGWAAGQGYRLDVSRLEPFEAYWVMNLTDSAVTLGIPPREASAAPAPAARHDGAPAADDDPGDETWEVQIAATCGKTRDAYNCAGVRPDGRGARDQHDRSEPPMPPGESIALYFVGASGADRPDRLAVDIRGPGPAQSGGPAGSTDGDVRGHLWYFDVARNFSRGAGGDAVVLNFSGIEQVPPEAEVLLVDRDLQELVDLRNDPRYEFIGGRRDFVAGGDEARFVLVVGDEAFVALEQGQLPRLPAETTLKQNYPNPFNPSTVIRYDLATSGHVSLRIFNVSGALVRVLEDADRAPGRYEVAWRGEDDRGAQVASGVYFYRLTAPGYSHTLKMVLLK